MKHITQSFAVVLSLALILASLPPSAIANGMTAVGKPVVFQPVSMHLGLNPGGVPMENSAIMPGDLVAAPQNVVTDVMVKSAPISERVVLTPDEIVTVEGETLGAKAQAGNLPVVTKAATPVQSKTLWGWLKNFRVKSGGEKVNWDNAAQRPEFNEPPAASINTNKETLPQAKEPTVSPETRSKILGIFNNLRAQGFPGIQWQAMLPRGIKHVRISLVETQSPKDYQYDALIPIGALSPTAPTQDPNEADYFVLIRFGGPTGGAVYSNRISLKTSDGPPAIAAKDAAGSQVVPVSRAEIRVWAPKNAILPTMVAMVHSEIEAIKVILNRSVTKSVFLKEIGEARTAYLDFYVKSQPNEIFQAWFQVVLSVLDKVQEQAVSAKDLATMKEPVLAYLNKMDTYINSLDAGSGASVQTAPAARGLFGMLPHLSKTAAAVLLMPAGFVVAMVPAVILGQVTIFALPFAAAVGALFAYIISSHKTPSSRIKAMGLAAAGFVVGMLPAVITGAAPIFALPFAAALGAFFAYIMIPSHKTRAKPSAWFDRLFHTQRRAAEAFGAISVLFWTGLASGKLKGEEALKMLRLVSSEYADAARFKHGDATLSSMRGAMGYGKLEIGRILSLLQARSGMKLVASTRVFINKEDADYVPAEDTPLGQTPVYSVKVYQAPGATPDSPALVWLDFLYPTHLRMGDALSQTSLKNLSTLDGLYLVKSLSSLGEAGRFAGDTVQVLDPDAAGKSLAAVVTALDASKSPSFKNYTSGTGDVGTEYYFKVSDPASGLEVAQDEGSASYPTRDDKKLAKELGRQVAILGTHIVRRFLGDDVTHVPSALKQDGGAKTLMVVSSESQEKGKLPVVREGYKAGPAIADKPTKGNSGKVVMGALLAIGSLSPAFAAIFGVGMKVVAGGIIGDIVGFVLGFAYGSKVSSRDGLFGSGMMAVLDGISYGMVGAAVLGVVGLIVGAMIL